MAYINKSSLLSDIGWGTQDVWQKCDYDCVWSERRTLSLRLCYISRDITITSDDDGQRAVQLHSPDGKGVCIVRFPDPATCSDWLAAMHSTAMLLTQEARNDVNKMIGSAPIERHVNRMGWLAEQVIGCDVVCEEWNVSYFRLFDSRCGMYSVQW